MDEDVSRERTPEVEDYLKKLRSITDSTPDEVLWRLDSHINEIFSIFENLEGIADLLKGAPQVSFGTTPLRNPNYRQWAIKILEHLVITLGPHIEEGSEEFQEKLKELKERHEAHQHQLEAVDETQEKWKERFKQQIDEHNRRILEGFGELYRDTAITNPRQLRDVGGVVEIAQTVSKNVQNEYIEAKTRGRLPQSPEAASQAFLEQMQRLELGLPQNATETLVEIFKQAQEQARLQEKLDLFAKRAAYTHSVVIPETLRELLNSGSPEIEKQVQEVIDRVTGEVAQRNEALATLREQSMPHVVTQLRRINPGDSPTFDTLVIEFVNHWNEHLDRPSGILPSKKELRESLVSRLKAKGVDIEISENAFDTYLSKIAFASPVVKQLLQQAPPLPVGISVETVRPPTGLPIEAARRSLFHRIRMFAADTQLTVSRWWSGFFDTFSSMLGINLPSVPSGEGFFDVPSIPSLGLPRTPRSPRIPGRLRGLGQRAGSFFGRRTVGSLAQSALTKNPTVLLLILLVSVPFLLAFTSSQDVVRTAALLPIGKYAPGLPANIASGTCPITEPHHITLGTYTNGGHGTDYYWNNIYNCDPATPEREKYCFNIPDSGLYTGCNNPSSPSCVDSNGNSYYGLAIDVVPNSRALAEVSVPYVCPTGEPCPDAVITWKVDYTFAGSQGTGAFLDAFVDNNGILSNSVNGHRWRIYIMHIDYNGRGIYTTRPGENVIGTLTDRAAPPHVHFELTMDGIPVDPTPFCDGTAPPPPGGACQVPGIGYCSINDPTTKLSDTFGSQAENAARICYKESGGYPAALNDNCLLASDGSNNENVDDGDPNNDDPPNCVDLNDTVANGCPEPEYDGATADYSVGLFQINLHPNARGCPGAWEDNAGKPLEWCKIKDAAALEACRTELENPAKNVEIAKDMYDARSWQPWMGSANACGIPY